MSDLCRAPAFQFYAADWLADENVRLLSLEETGAYIDAIALCWREGSIPSCPEKLARLIGKGCSTYVATVVQRLFNVRSNDGERLQHKRLEIERSKQIQRRDQQSNAGKMSAKSRSKPKQKQELERNEHTFNGRSTHVQHPLNSSSSSSDEDGGVCETPKIYEISASAESERGITDDGKSKPKQRRNHVSAIPPDANPEITNRMIDGRKCYYDDDRLVWEADFIREWNSLDGVAVHSRMELATSERAELIERLSEPDWFYREAFKKCPFWTPSGIRHSLTQFLRMGFVTKVINGDFAEPSNKARAKPAVDVHAGIRAIRERERKKNEDKMSELGSVFGNDRMAGVGVSEINA